MNTALLKTILRILLGIALSVLILIISLAFIGIGFASGVILSSWEIVRDVDLSQLEYDQAKIWKQHLEVYSSICTVQREDSGDFLLKKLERLAYEKTPQKPHKDGQYSTNLDPAGNSGRVWIYLQGFHYPHADHDPFLVEIDLRQGKIVAIRNANGADIPSFDLQPELIGEQYNKAGEAREIVSLAQMRRNEYLLKAFLAIEDKRFYQHWGVDVHGIISAFWQLSKGARLRGASTITQQLTRNIYLTPERRIMRKIKEALLAVRIEARFSKDEILEKYLNLINLGRYSAREVLGVQEAAMSYFGKPVWELDIHECATLAGIPKSPTLYSPIRHPDKSKARRDLVLDLMRREKFITEEEYEKSKNAPFDIRAPEGTKRREAPHFVDYIHQQLLGMPILKDRLYNQGLKVYTTIDVSMQEVAEQAVAEHLRELDKRFKTPNYDANLKNKNGINPITNYLQAALVAIEPQTGHIKAMVGGRNYFLPRWFRAKGINGNFLNRAVQSQRQPGSAFKPIVFTGLFERPSLVNPATIIDDKAWFVETHKNKRYAPRNYGGRYFGQVTVRRVLEKSINVATAKQTWETRPEENGKPEGINRAVSLAKRLGIRSSLRPYPSLALGASEVTPLEITAAYAVFANGGVRAAPIDIQYIEGRDGELLFQNEVQTKRVLDADVAYLITHLMEGVIKDGTGVRARRSGLTRPAAGKTGTTDDFTDAWFVGYIQNLAVGVWVGFDSPRKSTRSEGAKAALPIWTRVMLDGARGPSKTFDVPSTVVFRKIDKETGLLASAKCTNTITEAFLDGYAPKTICREHE